MSVTGFNLMRRRQKELELKDENYKDYTLADYTNAELRVMLDNRNIEYNPRATKKELIELVEGE